MLHCDIYRNTQAFMCVYTYHMQSKHLFKYVFISYMYISKRQFSGNKYSLDKCQVLL